ncbi:MAG: putative dehydrogenase [Saprospiraceae bacterium]|jgi:predicted dehydrogenase
MKNNPTRRAFLKKASIAAAGISIVPRHVLGGVGYVAPSDQIRIATVGAGGKGHSDTWRASGMKKAGGKATEQIVALCDVDMNTAAETFAMFPKAKKYKDYRRMLAEMDNEIDAVIISTPDHMHAPVGMDAISRGKHVYIQKPLAHDVYEARMLTEAARKHNVVTQMGNQGSSSDDIRRISEWIQSGIIGDVTQVHAWTNRPVWEQAMYRPTEKVEIPSHIEWDLFLGSAPERPYHPTYHPFGWRGWWDFGTGALGDMACHIIDPAVRALKLKYPTHVQAFAPFKVKDWNRVNSFESPPLATIVHYDFAARENMPEVRMSWYDGGLMPPRPAELMDDEPMGNWDGGVIFEGTAGKIMCDCYAANPRLLPLKRMDSFKEPEQTLARVKNENHQQNWISAIRGDEEASSSFDYAGPLTEIVLMGNLAIRSLYAQEERDDRGKKYMAYTGTGIRLAWDGEAMNITNYDPANQFVKREYRDGFGLKI